MYIDHSSLFGTPKEISCYSLKNIMALRNSDQSQRHSLMQLFNLVHLEFYRSMIFSMIIPLLPFSAEVHIWQNNISAFFSIAGSLMFAVQPLTQGFAQSGRLETNSAVYRYSNSVGAGRSLIVILL